MKTPAMFEVPAQVEDPEALELFGLHGLLHDLEQTEDWLA